MYLPTRTLLTFWKSRSCSVRVGKYMEVVLDEKSRTKAEAQVEDMCRRLLANLVIERYRFELEEVSS